MKYLSKRALCLQILKENSRITVGDILGWLASGMTYVQIIEDFPELKERDILNALAFAAAKENRTTTVAA